MPENTDASQSRQLEIRDYITRDDVRRDRDKIFLFGDNLQKQDYGGQAKEMRGEENSIGIPTKKAPGNHPNSFFTDKEFAANKKAIDEAFGKIPPDKIIVIPKAGLGTDSAQLAEKAPDTFAYLGSKLARLGYDNAKEKSAKTAASNSMGDNKVFVQNTSENSPGAKRLLDLNNIQTPSLSSLSPTKKEVTELKNDSKQSLAEYANRLRADYKTNKDNIRDGFKLLSDSLDKGERITITCSCRAKGGICHSDVVKMAIEKVNIHLKTGQIQGKTSAENRITGQNNSLKQPSIPNPRTLRAINEFLSFSENDRNLEKINETDGRNRSEQASYLGKSSQFARDIYEHGASVVGGNLIIPQEKLTISPPLEVTTESYAVGRIGEMLQDETRAKNLAPIVVEYGNKIAGASTDGETRLKVFGWIYDSLEGRSDSAGRDENSFLGEKPTFEETLEKIRCLAEEMHALEPLDKQTYVPLSGFEQGEVRGPARSDLDDNLNLEEIYERAIGFEDYEKNTDHFVQQQAETLAPSEKIDNFGFERIELNGNAPRIPADFTQTEITGLLNDTLPEIDRQLENGVSAKEILAPFNEAVWQSKQEEAISRLESIYLKGQNTIGEAQQSKGKTQNSSQTARKQSTKMDLRRQTVVELKLPGDYILAEKEAINSFYRLQKQEIGGLLTKIDEVREKQGEAADKKEEMTLKKELSSIREAKPNFAFKLENSSELVVGTPSEQSVETRNFISAYVNYQLKQPETRLRAENERYRVYAVRLESAAIRADVMKVSSEIRAENAALGFKWKDLEKGKKEKLPRPLTNREMQFLFTETSPAHYTGEMTAVRLSYAHSGASRRRVAESLIKGEINPSPEAQKLIESLESRLQRPKITDSISATKHFFESLKASNEKLKYKNTFDHREIYQKLPPQEKDFVYARAAQQKENLEYNFVFKKQQLNKEEEIGRIEQPKQQLSQAEKKFHLHSEFNQARILGDKLEPVSLAQKEISERDVKAIAVLLGNQPTQKLENLALEFQKSESPENKKIGEVVQTFARTEISQSENKTIVSIKLPESKQVGVETYRELLEKFYPDAEFEKAKYKFEHFGEKEVSRTLQKGQDEAVNNFRDEIKCNVYRTDSPANVLETETTILEKLDKIAQFQTEARNALCENKSILGKYVARAGAGIQNQKTEVPSPSNQKEIVKLALGGKSSNPVSNKVHDQFLQAALKEITISDFQKFSANESILDEMKANIKNEFAEISEGLKVLEENKLNSAKTFESAEKGQGISGNTTNQEIVENKPFTLRLFEKELEKAERWILAASLKEKLSADTDLEKEKNLNLQVFFSNEERGAIKARAFEVVKEKLEPKELNAEDRKLTPEASRQAFATYKQLERASNLFQTGGDKSKITEAFSKLDREAAILNQIRQDYNRNEKMALLRDGIKTDLVDWFKKNTDTKQAGMEGQINKILMNNLRQFDSIKFSDDRGQISVLSRQIAEKIESKQILATKYKVLSADTQEPIKKAKNQYSLSYERVKTNLLEKVKDAPNFTR